MQRRRRDITVAHSVSCGAQAYQQGSALEEGDRLAGGMIEVDTISVALSEGWRLGCGH